MSGSARRLTVSVVAAVAIVGCATFPDRAETRDRGEQMISQSFTAPEPRLLTRLTQDESQKICSRIQGAPLKQEEAAQVVALARASIKYPASGRLSGDWRIGEKLAYDGAGDRIQFGRLETRKENGALCQNCHALNPGDVNVGNVGPSLTGYGARGNSEAIVKYTYERIYNAWAFFPCSNMPRLGTTGHLTPEQITHLVAYLTDPKSPLNQR